MKNSLNEIKSNKVLLRTLVGLSFVLVFIFGSFRLIHKQSKENLKNSISTFTRNEHLSTNAYSLAKLISDLEYLNQMECVVLTEGATKNAYYDTSNLPKCSTFFQTTSFVNFEFYAINGSKFDLQYRIPTSWMVIIAELLSYLITGILGLAYYRFTCNELAVSELKIANAIIAASTVEMISKQVAHDIRSPLAALNVAMSTISGLEEYNRVLMRNAISRINDIANQLLEKSNTTYVGKMNTAGVLGANSEDCYALMPTLLAPLVDSIVSEKRVLFRSMQMVDLEADLNEAYGLFANVNEVELKRVISNLINNSVEAFVEGRGRVVVSIRSLTERVAIVISDNGRGIPNSVLARLGEMGFSYGKASSKSGAGLGLFHAKETVKNFGGNFKISSEEGVGTTIEISLPKVKPPDWFVEKLVTPVGSMIISVDDDLSIHGIWRRRYESFGSNAPVVSHLSFTSGADFKTWHSANHTKYMHLFFLVDYELLNQTKTGLDLIEEMNISENAVLVTSRYEESEIRERCARLGVRLIPKAMAGSVPIELQKHRVKYDAVLIDDDKDITHLCWSLYAKENEKSFKGFSAIEEFFDEAFGIHPDTPIYLDSNLGIGVKGESFVPAIAARGFKTIYIATGYEASSIPLSNAIKGVVGKEPRY